ncbi:hypothetical protein T4B_1228 [Trichinella pseudospiralis]|uniref:Uncharacterized protein n=3 Tax=Trichinella TaxID=6333 RepID=A0A0V1E492_TRIPS|nr:hypothetical protein T05_10978 [Trichinella murrelli]KRY21732.1 hypothetical protein T12_12123 [Trichinella patagoniensis]KRY68672.1 hypothetical protein T4A_4137 [Trichinella pseudospiralis]KRX33574.1 hypothetical protein T05_791 [Trichinella murrelli]KRX33635.1 hypothetical protein T05_6716 [Trichinella murrelli]
MPCTCRPSIFWTERTSLAATRAPMSSSLGRVNLRIGATRVFDVTKFTTEWWFVVSIRMYATAPYAFSDESQKAWISKRVTWPRATGTSARGRRIFDRCGSSCFQRLHCSITSCGNGSSHDVPRCHRVWRNIFARTVNGAKHPTGSKTRNAVLNNDRFDSPLGLFTMAGGEKVKTSPRRSHCIPSVFQRWLLLEADLTSSGTDVNASGSLLAHLCRWKPPLANSPRNSPANSLASSIVSHDVARSSTYMFSKISAAARGAASW